MKITINDPNITFTVTDVPKPICWECIKALQTLMPSAKVCYYRNKDVKIIGYIVCVHIKQMPSENDIVEAVERGVAVYEHSTVKDKDAVEAWSAPVLPVAKNKVENDMVKCIMQVIKYAKNSAAGGDYYAAKCEMNDCKDLVSIYEHLRQEHQATVRRLVESLDTNVRERIPESVWQWIHA